MGINTEIAAKIAEEKDIPRELKKLGDITINIEEVLNSVVEKFQPVLSCGVDTAEKSKVEPEMVPLAYIIYTHNEKLSGILDTLRYLNSSCQL